VQHREIATGGVPIKAWVKGVPFEERAQEQLRRTAELPIVHGWVAAMPDVHAGIGSTIGTVVPTLGAIVPAAVGVDIGCGMMAVRTTICASRLPDDLAPIRSAIEKAVPHGRTNQGGRGDRGAWGEAPGIVTQRAALLDEGYQRILAAHGSLNRGNTWNHLGTLGTGNHFIEVCLDEQDRVWVMLHSGSRGVGNRIGSHFIALAKKEAERQQLELPDGNLAWLSEGSRLFDDYVHAVGWAQDFARSNREVMMELVLQAMAKSGLPGFRGTDEAVNCHHNYVQKEFHLGRDVFVTRKGAVRAGEGDLGIIPGSMGARSYIVRGKGNPDSFESCSHGAGRAMSRTAARKRFTVEDHLRATAGIECRKDEGVIDETPAAYKDIDKVMEAQSDLVEIVHRLRQVICVKG